MSYEVFNWRGEPIIDIRQWARERGEQMVRYHAERYVVVPGVTVPVKEERDGEMPESFWQGLLMQHGWHYTEVGRSQP